MNVTRSVIGCAVALAVTLSGGVAVADQVARPGRTASAVPAGFAPVSVSFVTEHRGWVLGSAPCGQAQCTVVLRTVDGGRTWRRVGAPSASVETGTDDPAAVDTVRFADRSNGYAAGVGLWQTHDGGARWTRERTVAGIPNAVARDVVVSGRTVYALVSGTEPKYGGSDSHFRLVSAPVATGTFHFVADLGIDSEPDDLVSSGGVVYFVNSLDLLSKGFLVRVDGRALTQRRLPVHGCNVAASTSSRLLLACGDGVAGGAMGSRTLYGSTNSGRTFTRLHNPGRGAGYDGSAIAATTNGHAVITTSSTPMAALRSTSGGARSWHTSLQIKNGYFTEFGFEDARYGAVIASLDSRHNPIARLYRTSAGGATWHRISFT